MSCDVFLPTHVHIVPIWPSRHIIFCEDAYPRATSAVRVFLSIRVLGQITIESPWYLLKQITGFRVVCMVDQVLPFASTSMYLSLQYIVLFIYIHIYIHTYIMAAVLVMQIPHVWHVCTVRHVNTVNSVSIEFNECIAASAMPARLLLPAMLEGAGCGWDPRPGLSSAGY